MRKNKRLSKKIGEIQKIMGKKEKKLIEIKIIIFYLIDLNNLDLGYSSYECIS